MVEAEARRRGRIKMLLLAMFFAAPMGSGAYASLGVVAPAGARGKTAAIFTFCMATLGTAMGPFAAALMRQLDAPTVDLQGLPAKLRRDLLIATDCISEGQNLQDCAIVVNWDMPWTIIKIIQRAGRVETLHAARIDDVPALAPGDRATGRRRLAPHVAQAEHRPGARHLDDGLPEPLRMALSQLQSQAPPMSNDLVRDVIREELGGEVEDLFVEFDERTGDCHAQCAGLTSNTAALNVTVNVVCGFCFNNTKRFGCCSALQSIREIVFELTSVDHYFASTWT